MSESRKKENKTASLSTRQIDLIEDLFNAELGEQEILVKHKVSKRLFGKWLTEENFNEHLKRRIEASLIQNAVYLVKYASFATAKLVDLTNSKNAETARKACLDIISSQNEIQKSICKPKEKNIAESPSDLPVKITPETSSKMLSLLAEDSSDEK